MPSFNKVILAGNLTRDLELKYTASNVAICNFGLAVNRKWKDQEEVCFVDCTAFGKQAETLNQYMSKGKPILIEGRLNYRTWEGKDGRKNSKLDVVVENFTFLGSKGDGSGSGAGESHPPQQDGYDGPLPF